MRTAWPSLPFDEVLEDVSAGQPKTLARDFLAEGRFPLVDQGQDQIGGYTDDEARLATVQLPVIVFGDHTRAVKYIDFPFGVGADGVKLLRPRGEGHVPYFFRFLQAARIPAAGYDRHFKYLKRIQIPLPPIEEQRRIAAELDKVDDLRAKRQVSLTLLDSFCESVFLSMFGDPVSNPARWPLVPFADVCHTRLGKMLDQKRQSGANRRPYLRNANVRWFEFDLADLAEMDFDASDRTEFRVEPGDLLICEGGEAGRAAVWRGEVEEIYFQKALHRGRPDPSKATPTYLVHLLWHLARRGGLVDHISSATIAHLTGVRLKTMKVPVPDLDLQHEFGRRLSAADLCRSHLKRSTDDLRALFSSLQHRAFAGQL